MHTYISVTFKIWLLCCISLPAIAGTRITHLQTEYLPNPIGIEVERPRFSWQMESDVRGASQIAYQIVVAKSEQELQAKKYYYDSGKTESSESVAIPYNGNILKPSTRYYWKVEVWDNQGNVATSEETAYFETGLMGSGWNNAQWIGASHPQLSRYRSHYVIDYDIQIAKGSNKGTFVFGVRDKDNYVTVELDISKKSAPLLRILHTTEGKTINDAEKELSAIINAQNLFEKHHVSINVKTNQYSMQYILAISIDGQVIEDNLRIIPYPDGELYYLCRLFGIGFKQPTGQQALFSNIRIWENTWNTTLYQTPEIFDIKGKGEMETWEPGEVDAAPMIRKKINLTKDIRKASLYATARGIYEGYINGRKINGDYFNPGWTDYRFRLMYNTYDVTSLLKKGDNTIGAIIGTGWWSDHNGFSTDWQDQYGSQESFLGKLLVEYTDGTREIFVTDHTWKCFDKGPILSGSMQMGEDYDARREVKDWCIPSFDDSSWGYVTVHPALPASVKLQAYIGKTITNNIQIKAIEVKEPKPGVFVYDMGQNMVGIPRIKVNGKAGQTILLQYGEMNYPETIPTDPIPPYTIELI